MMMYIPSVERLQCNCFNCVPYRSWFSILPACLRTTSVVVWKLSMPFMLYSTLILHGPSITPSRPAHALNLLPHVALFSGTGRRALHVTSLGASPGWGGNLMIHHNGLYERDGATRILVLVPPTMGRCAHPSNCCPAWSPHRWSECEK